jgi:hypothetical protein
LKAPRSVQQVGILDRVGSFLEKRRKPLKYLNHLTLKLRRPVEQEAPFLVAAEPRLQYQATSIRYQTGRRYALINLGSPADRHL